MVADSPDSAIRTILEVPVVSGEAMWVARPTLSGAAARRLVDAAVAEAASMAVPVTVVIVDESGVLKEMCRMDGAPLVSVQTAVNKAYAAAAIGMPPDEFYAAIESDGAAVASFATRPGMALVAGGLPVLADGGVAGAIGVAGAMTAADDRRIAEAAITAAANPPVTADWASATAP
jgi:glc operon protein GlcG